MDKLVFKPSEQTPEIILDPTGKIEFSGVSIPEDSNYFFTPVLNWLEKYSENPAPTTVVTFNIVYCNTSSSMYISEMLRRLRKAHEKGNPVTVTWFYEEDDEDMKMLGEDFKRINKVEFSMVAVPAAQ